MSTWKTLAVASLIFPAGAIFAELMCLYHIKRRNWPARLRWAVITLALCLSTLISATIFDDSWITIALWTFNVLGWLFHVITMRRRDLRRAHDEAEARRAKHQQEAASQWQIIFDRQVWAQHREQQYRQAGAYHPRPLELDTPRWIDMQPTQPLELNAAPEPREDDVK